MLEKTLKKDKKVYIFIFIGVMVQLRVAIMTPEAGFFCLGRENFFPREEN